MRILVNMEIESDDYGGKEFCEEIKKLIKDIDSSDKTSLIRFEMRGKHKKYDNRDFLWNRTET